MRTFTAVLTSALTSALLASALVATVGNAQIVRRASTESGTASAPDQRADSPEEQAVLDRARFAQRAFEEYRHLHLPHVMSRRPPDCDERVGARCYWYAEGHELPAEPAEIGSARTQFLLELESLARTAPNSRWITTQRVRYLVEAARASDALQIARSCPGDGAGNGWRCEILVGFALHALGSYGDAERTYDSAISHMPAPDQCAWRDMSLLLDDVARAQYRSARCGDAERAQWESRTWSLARTLYSMPGNDSRTEYFARMTMVQMLQEGIGPYQRHFDEDERETLLRFGWPRTWAAERVLPFSVGVGDTSIMPRGPGTSIGAKGKGKGGTGVGSYPPGISIPKSVPPMTRPPDMPRSPLPGNSGGAPEDRTALPRLPSIEMKGRDDDGISVVGMEAVPAYRYIPAGFVLNDPIRADSSEWRKNVAPVYARYAPPYAKSLTALEHQQAVFKRGDSAIVVMAYDTRGATGVGGAPTLRAGLVVSTAGESPREIAVRRDSAPATGVLTARASWGPLLMSAELAAPARNAVARARYGVGPMPGPTHRVILSDVLLYRPGASIPASVEEVAPLALATDRVRSRERLGVYWEAYGTDPAGENIKVSVIVMKEAADEGGFLSRLGRTLSGNRSATPVSITVDDLSARGASTSSRALALDISTLTKGSYVVQLEITVAGQPTLRTERRIEVTGP